jgi:2-methylcitrate dehydratase PrpD
VPRDGTAPASLSSRLVEWTSSLQVDSVPNDMAERAKHLLLDAVGVRIAAEKTHLGVTARSGLAGFTRRPGDWSGQPALEAYYQGTLTAALDFDDTHDETLLHPSSFIVPALLSVARHRGITGDNFLAGLIAGYEAVCRLGNAAPKRFHARGFHPTGVLGAAGAAIAISRALELDPATAEDAVGIAASTGGGLLQAMIDGTEARYINSGNAALGGVLACQMAIGGFTGAGHPLDGPSGLLRAHIQNDEEIDLDACTRELGDVWKLAGINAKPYPTGYVTHEFLDVILALVRSGQVSAETIAAITCVLPETAAALVFQPLDVKRKPDGTTAARVALPHMLAEAVVYGEIGSDSFEKTRLKDPRVVALAARIDFRIGRTSVDNAMEMELADGRQFAVPTQMRVMTNADMMRKFTRNVEPVLGGEGMKRLAAALRGIELADNVSKIPGLVPETSRIFDPV